MLKALPATILSFVAHSASSVFSELFVFFAPLLHGSDHVGKLLADAVAGYLMIEKRLG